MKDLTFLRLFGVLKALREPTDIVHFDKIRQIIEGKEVTY